MDGDLIKIKEDALKIQEADVEDSIRSIENENTKSSLVLGFAAALLGVTFQILDALPKDAVQQHETPGNGPARLHEHQARDRSMPPQVAHPVDQVIEAEQLPPPRPTHRSTEVGWHDDAPDEPR